MAAVDEHGQPDQPGPTVVSDGLECGTDGPSGEEDFATCRVVAERHAAPIHREPQLSTIHMISTISGTIVVIVPPCMSYGG